MSTHIHTIYFVAVGYSITSKLMILYGIDCFSFYIKQFTTYVHINNMYFYFSLVLWPYVILLQVGNGRGGTETNKLVL